MKEEVEEFLKKEGLDGVPVLFMATHSIGGRAWTIEEGRDPAFFEEPCFGRDAGWFVFREEDVNHLFSSSATSDSSLTAKKEAWPPNGRTWTVTLEVPVDDSGQPYKGAYWSAFHESILGEPKAEEEAPSV